MKFFKTSILCALLSLLAAFQASAQSIVGAWTVGATTVEGASVIVFLANGYYFQIQNAQASEAPHGFDGFERGTYTWNPATGALTVTTIQDLNGDTGFTAPNGASGVTFTVSGDTATFAIPGEGTITGITRVTGTSPIVGAWSFGNAALANDSAVLVFLPNGVYFMAQDGPAGDPTCPDGIEHGTYTWNPTTGLMTSSRAPAPYVDTNGECGLSHTGTQLTFLVSADGLTLNGTTTDESFSAARVGAGAGAAGPITPRTGIWWASNESGSGYALDYRNGVLVVTIYSYQAGGAPQWYLASGPVSGNVFTATLDKYVGGQCISCTYRAPTPAGNDGVITITFTSSTSATVQLPGGRITQIQLFDF